ncbi:MAG TPA: ELWxxDGT repeat protein [Thermoanaerobaculia bacterium]|jgi:ELWxxDGT repeat protein|nr:ELWxxDGT repeat protein [Thermoanaerobaculia bacterium]
MTHRLPAIVLALVLSLLSLSTATAQPAFQVKDINPTDGERAGVLTLLQTFATLGTDAYFLADDGISGPELWKSDGSDPGTVLVKDVCPGACGGWPRGLSVVGGTLYFTADDGVHGRELWKTDGTAAGTVLVKDIRPGLGDGLPTTTFRSLGGYLYFAADDGVNGLELWRTDGTAAGTTLVADIRPGSAGSEPVMRVAAGGLLLFSANDGVHGGEPWVTDGTGAGTAMVKDVNASAGTSVLSVYAPQVSDLIDGPPQDWIAAPWGGFLLAADDGVNGLELWTTDGTGAGTALVSDIYPGAQGSFLADLTPMGGFVYFAAYEPTAGYQLWKTDGTGAGTARVTTIDGGAAGGWPRELTRVGSTLYFLAKDLDHGRELWKSDGTAAGTSLVEDITPGTAGSFSDDSISGLTELGGKLLFFARQGYWMAIWSSDGTEAGTVQVADLTGLTAPVSVTFCWSWAIAGGRLFFNGYGLPHGFVLWSTNGTGAGTGMVWRHDETTSSIAVWLGRLNEGATWGALGSRLLFPATDGATGREPWVSTGTAAGTTSLGDLDSGDGGSYPGHFTPLGGAAYFSDNQGLRKTNGTPAGTQMLDAAGVQSTELAPYGAYLLFSGDSASSGVELWRTNGTSAGTVQVRDIHPGASSNSGNPAELTLSGGLVYFSANDGAIGSELWRSDATYAGTVRVKDIRPVGASSSPTGLADLGGVLLFSAETNAEGRELWRSTGTEASTYLVKDIRPGSASSIRPLDEWGDRLRAVAGSYYYFVADDGSSGEELWRSDGTEAGTVRVKDVFPGARGSEPRSLTAVGTRLFFVADDGEHGREVWVTDGTEPGTHLVEDLVPGEGSPVPRALTAAHGVLLFTAWDATHGAEIWKSDGTAAGTDLLMDIAPGAASSSPLAFTVAGPWVFFAANDGLTGFEPWVISRAALGSALDFYTVEPCRLIDTRTAGGPINSGTPRTISAAGSCNIPDDAVALSINITVIAPAASGRVVLYASGTPTPGTSTINFGAGPTRVNNALVTLGPAGLEALPTLNGGGQVDIVVDVNGYFK